MESQEVVSESIAPVTQSVVAKLAKPAHILHVGYRLVPESVESVESVLSEILTKEIWDRHKADMYTAIT